MKEKLFEILRWAAVVGIIVLLVLLGAKNKESTAEYADVRQAVLAEMDLGELQQADNQMVKRLYGLQPAEYAGCTLYYPTTNMGAEEVLLIRLSDPEQEQAVLSAIEKRLQTQKNSFDGYGVQQYDLLTNHAVIEARGGYVLFAVCPNDEAVRQAFLGAV